MFEPRVPTAGVRAYRDNVLPIDIFRDLADYARTIVNGEAGIPGFSTTLVWHILRELIEEKFGQIDLHAAFFVETASQSAGSQPHYDHGMHSAVLHLNNHWSLAWGGDFFFCKDFDTIDHAIEFVPNRLVVWDKNQLHMHRPPTAAAPDRRVVLVMRFMNAF